MDALDQCKYQEILFHKPFLAHCILLATLVTFHGISHLFLRGHGCLRSLGFGRREVENSVFGFYQTLVSWGFIIISMGFRFWGREDQINKL